ncbi:MAG: pyridoxal kinase, partial [Oscillospiraceae bacterium]|nr:pyridoxal kinase [Oscillospiraceae bacterium]
FYGTGDVFASALAGLLVRGAPLSDALETATALTDESICRSLWRDTPRHFGVDFEGALPAYIRRVEKIFEA